MASTELVSLLQWLVLLGIVAALLGGALLWARWVRLRRRELAAGIRQVKRALNAFADELTRMRAAAERFPPGDPEPLAAPAADLHALLIEANADYRARCAALDTFLHAQQPERRLPAALLAWWPPHLRRQRAEAERLAAGVAQLERHRRPFAAIISRIDAMPAQVARRKARLALLYNEIARSARQLQAAQVQLNGDRVIAATMRDTRAALRALPAIEPDAFAAEGATLAQNRAAVGATWAQLNTLEQQLRASEAAIAAWRAVHNDLLANLDSITSTLGAILQAFSELSQVRPYPIAWSTSSEELTALYGERNTCGGRMDPRDRNRLSRDLDRSRAVLARCNALLEQLATIRAGREAFVAFCREHGGLLVLPALWPQRVAPLSAEIARFPEAWWPEADRVATLVPDAQALYDRQLQLIPEDLSTPIDERAVGDRPDEARAFVAACERFQARLARIEQRLIELQAAESHNQAALIEVIRHNEGALAQIVKEIQETQNVPTYPVHWSQTAHLLDDFQKTHRDIGDWDLARSPAQLEADLAVAQRLRDDIVQVLVHVREVQHSRDALIDFVLVRGQEVQREPLWVQRARDLCNRALRYDGDARLETFATDKLVEDADRVARLQLELREVLASTTLAETEIAVKLAHVEHFVSERARIQDRIEGLAAQLRHIRAQEQSEREEAIQLVQQYEMLRDEILQRMLMLARDELAAIDWQSSERQRATLFAIRLPPRAELVSLSPQHIGRYLIDARQHVQELHDLRLSVNRVASTRDNIIKHVRTLQGKELDFPDPERFNAIWIQVQLYDAANWDSTLDISTLKRDYTDIERDRGATNDQIRYGRIEEDNITQTLGIVSQLIVRCTRYAQRFRRVSRILDHLHDEERRGFKLLAEHLQILRKSPALGLAVPAPIQPHQQDLLDAQSSGEKLQRDLGNRRSGTVSSKVAAIEQWLRSSKNALRAFEKELDNFVCSTNQRLLRSVPASPHYAKSHALKELHRGTERWSRQYAVLNSEQGQQAAQGDLRPMLRLGMDVHKHANRISSLLVTLDSVERDRNIVENEVKRFHTLAKMKGHPPIGRDISSLEAQLRETTNLLEHFYATSEADDAHRIAQELKTTYIRIASEIKSIIDHLTRQREAIKRMERRIQQLLDELKAYEAHPERLITTANQQANLQSTANAIRARIEKIHNRLSVALPRGSYHSLSPDDVEFGLQEVWRLASEDIHIMNQGVIDQRIIINTINADGAVTITMQASQFVK
jgi:sugar-specific transcriptional regulator TrmB